MQPLPAEAKWMRLSIAPGENQPTLEGLSVEGDPWQGMAPVPGPTDAAGGLLAPGCGERTIRLKLPRPLGPRGAVMVWFRLDRSYHAGPQAEDHTEPILELPGVFTLDFSSKPSGAAVRWDWGEAVEGVSHALRHVFTALPGLPGPGWYQAVYSWDAEKGAFERTLNGTTMRQPGAESAPWRILAERDFLDLHAGRFAIGDVWVSDAPMGDADALSALTPNFYRGTAAHLLGFRPAPKFAYEPDPAKLLYENPLAKPSDVDGWRMEGPAEVAFEDGWMAMWSPGEEFENTFWCDRDFPADFYATWQVQPLSQQRALAIVFFCAKGLRGEDIFDPSLAPRDGDFPLYHSGDINCYHVSYWAGSRAMSNMRKNRGFYLVENGPPGIPFGSKAAHTVHLLKQAGRIRLAVDDRLVIDFHDDGKAFGPVWGEGKMGFRQVRWTRGRYRGFRVYGV